MSNHAPLIKPSWDHYTFLPRNNEEPFVPGYQFSKSNWDTSGESAFPCAPAPPSRRRRVKQPSDLVCKEKAVFHNTSRDLAPVFNAVLLDQTAATNAADDAWLDISLEMMLAVPGPTLMDILEPEQPSEEEEPKRRIPRSCLRQSRRLASKKKEDKKARRGRQQKQN